MDVVLIGRSLIDATTTNRAFNSRPFGRGGSGPVGVQQSTFFLIYFLVRARFARVGAGGAEAA